MLPEHQVRFRHSEGFELMLRTLKERGFASHCALRAVDFAISRNSENAARMVSIGGLKILFPIFMGKDNRRQRKKYSISETTIEEHCISIVSSLALLLPKGRSSLQRLVRKFTEKDSVKTDRLIELYSKYVRKVNAAEKATSADSSFMQEYVVSAETRQYLRRLDAGLLSMHKIATIASTLCLQGSDTGLKDYINSKLTERNINIDNLSLHLTEYSGSLDTTKDNKVKVEYDKLTSLITELAMAPKDTPIEKNADAKETATSAETVDNKTKTSEATST